MAVIEGLERRIVGGVDTHKHLHVAAVVDEKDRVLRHDPPRLPVDAGLDAVAWRLATHWRGIDRQLWRWPAVPVWTERKMPEIADRIAFMHIPKTAGVSVIDAFMDRLGAEACHPFSPTMADEDFSRKRFLSGHVYIGDITRNAFLFTFLRDPVKQLTSHLLWIDHLNMPEHEHKTIGLPASVREGIEALRGKDLSSARDLDRYLAGVPADSVLRIRNLQAELMSFRRGKVEAVGDKRLAEMAIGNLDRLGFVGLSESLADDMAALFGMLGLGEAPAIKRLNVAPSTNHIDISAPAVRRVLESYVQADIRLYEWAARMRSGRSWMDRAKRLFWR